MPGDDSAWVDYVLSSVGILFAGSILLLAICGVFRLTLPGNEQILLQEIALEVVNQIEEVDLKTFPYKYGFWLREGSYNATISCEYIAISNRNANYVRPLQFSVYPARNAFWNNTGEMRLYLKKEFGSEGTSDHRLEAGNASNISGLFSEMALNSSVHPVILERSKQVLLEKEFIYFDNGDRRGYVFVNQE